MFFGRNKNKEHEPWRDGVYLTTVQTTFEADIIESKLSSEGIPCIRRYEGGGNYLEIVFGQQNVFPIEIYVPEDALERAKDAIVSVPIDDDFEEADDISGDDAECHDAQNSAAGETGQRTEEKGQESQKENE